MNSPMPAVTAEQQEHADLTTHPRISPLVPRTLRLWALIALGALVGLAGGCGRNTAAIPAADHMHGPVPHQVRRLSDYRSEAFWSHLHPDIFEVVEALPRHMSVDQELTVREFGQPDYQREFEALTGEEVLEWLSMDHGVLHQFVDGTLVFQGEIRDLEHTLLRFGAPNSVMYRMQDPQIERVTFMYRRAFTTASQYFDFANGALIFEGRNQ